MIGFLIPTALLGLALLAIPVLLHIFKPRRVRQTPFTTLRWLRASQHRLSRRIKWHQVLLFLLRAAFITLLVLALAKPILAPDAEQGGVERFVILDSSRSMGYMKADGSTPFDLGRDLSQRVLERSGAGERATLIAVGDEPQAMGPMVEDTDAYRRQVTSLNVAPGGAPLTEALRLAGPMVDNKRENAAVELFVITDNQAGNWQQGDLARFVEQSELPVRVKVLDVGAHPAENAWVAAARLVEQGGRRFVRVEVGGVGDETLDRRLRMTGLPGLPEFSEQLRIEPGKFATARFMLPPEYNLNGKVATLQLLPGDALEADDTYWLNLDRSGAATVLVIEPATTQVASLQPGFHIRTAFEAINDASPGAVRVVRAQPDQVLGAQIAEADLIVLADVPETTSANVQAIEARVQQGAGLAVFVGPLVNAEFYNSVMHDPARPRSSLLPMTLGEVVTARGPEGGLAPIASVDWSHPLFARLFDPIYGDLSQARFEAYHRMEIPEGAAETTTVLSSIAGAAPAILERQLGAGRVLIFNTSANDAWSTLPRLKSYVPLVDRMLSHLAGGVGRGMFTFGETVTAPLPQGVDPDNVLVVTPSGAPLRPAVRTVAGRQMVQLEGLSQPGVYEVQWTGPSGEGSLPLVVQADTRESQLMPMDEQVLSQWWSPAEFDVYRPGDVEAEIGLGEARTSLEPWLLLAAALVFIAEMFFVHYLCPKMNPSVATRSVVQKRGFFEDNQRAAEARSQEKREPEPAGA